MANQARPPASAITAELGARIRTRRKALGLTLEELADRADVHWTAIGQIERGQREARLRNLLKIARALEIEPGELVDGLPSLPQGGLT